MQGIDDKVKHIICNKPYKFELYLKLLFSILFYRRVQNYDTFLNIDEGQDLYLSYRVQIIQFSKWWECNI